MQQNLCMHPRPWWPAAVGSRGALRFDSPGSKLSYILILYSANWRFKIRNWLVNTWEEITELQGLTAHAIVLNPCLPTICHGRSPDLAFDTVVEIKHVHLHSRWLCRFLWHHTNMEETESSLILESEERFSLTTPIQTRWDPRCLCLLGQVIAAETASQSCNQRLTAIFVCNCKITIINDG